VQNVAPVPVWYLPPAQLVQIAAAAAEYMPTAQFRQSLWTMDPVPTRNVPATHATHDVVPVLGW
jgi:hypothetical protein